MGSAVGITERGPVGKAILVTSFEEFVETFGGFTPNSDLVLAAQGFFENGGQILWVVRTVHYTDINTSTSKTSAAATLTLNDRALTPLPTLKVDAKWDGAYANDIRVAITAATSGAPDELNLTVEDNGLIAEVFPNLSMDPAKENYVETVVNHAERGSKLIKVDELSSATASPNDLPALGTFGPLTGGSDGLASLADIDFIGSSAGKAGIRALDCIQDLSLLIVPGRATSAVHNAMISYCEAARDKSCFAILDPPANQSATGIVRSQLDALLSFINAHINLASGAHAASALTYAGGGNWADGTTNPATTVEGELDKIISDLAATSGAPKVGAAATAGSPNAIVAGTVLGPIFMR